MLFWLSDDIASGKLLALSCMHQKHQPNHRLSAVLSPLYWSAYRACDYKYGYESTDFIHVRPFWCRHCWTIIMDNWSFVWFFFQSFSSSCMLSWKWRTVWASSFIIYLALILNMPFDVPSSLKCIDLDTGGKHLDLNTRKVRHLSLMKDWDMLTLNNVPSYGLKCVP